MHSKSQTQFTLRSVFIAVAVLAGVAAILAAIAGRKLAANDLDRLLTGDVNISLQRVRIELQQRIVDCTDPTVIEYLTTMMRAPSIPANGSGYTYYFTFDFSSGRTYSLYGDVGATQFSSSVPNAEPHDPGFPTHDVIFQSPVPKRVEEIFAFLVAPWEEVGGLELNVHSDQPLQYSYQPSLHGRNPAGSRIQELVNSPVSTDRTKR